MTIELDKATISTFEPHVGSTFTIRAGESTLNLVLDRVAEWGSSPRRPRAFSLYFRLDAEGILPQRTYDLTHSELGELSIFLVPVNEPSKGLLYEAVFN